MAERVRDLVKVCYDKDKAELTYGAMGELLFYLGKQKRPLTQKVVDEYGLPKLWVGKTVAFTLPVIDSRTIRKINRNHMFEDLEFVDLDAPLMDLPFNK